MPIRETFVARVQRHGPLLAALLVPFVVFVRAVGFPFVNWDDPSHFLQNPLWEHPLLRGWAGLYHTLEIGYPAPLLLLSFWLDRLPFGVSPAFMHAENLALHLGIVALLFRVAERVGLRRMEALAVALIFSIHPLVVEPVCWLTGRKDLLSNTILFATCLLACGDPRSDAFPKLRRWIAVDVLAVAGVLILPRMVIAPVLIGLVVYAARPSWSPWKIGLRLAPALAGCGVLGAIASRQLERVGGLFERRPGEVVADMAAAWALQAEHAVWPVDLSSYYYRVPGDPSLAWMIAAALLVPIVAVLALRFTPQRGPERVGLLFCAVAYFPASNLFGNRRWTADSYMVLPLVGLLIAAVPAIARRWPPRLARFGRVIWPILVAVLALVSFAGTSRWSSSTNVWAGVMERYPMKAQAYEQKALGFLFDGREAEAYAVFIELAEKFPDYDDNYEHQFLAYEAKGDHPRALERLDRGLRAGSYICARVYWQRLLASPAPPPPAERDLVGSAFGLTFDVMKRNNHDPRFFGRVRRVLEAVGLTELAASVAAHVATMPSG